MKSACASPEADLVIHYSRVAQIPHIINTALDIGIFDTLVDRYRTAGSIAAERSLSVAALKRFLRVLCALGLVDRSGNTYTAAAVTKRYLCSGSGCFLGDMFKHGITLQEQWSRAGKALKTGTMPVPSQDRLGAFQDQLGVFLRSMHAVGLIQSAQVIGMLDMDNIGSILDLGGGRGTYAAAAVQAGGHVRGTVYDLPDVVQHTRAFIHEAGLGDRIEVHAGQCLSDKLPAGPFDCVMVSNLLHIYNEKDCRKIIEKAVRVLSDCGVLVIHDYLFGSGDGLAVSMVDMTMLTGTPEGRCHDVEYIQQWMEAASITGIRKAPVSGGSTVIWGTKKGTSRND